MLNNTVANQSYLVLFDTFLYATGDLYISILKYMLANVQINS